MVKLFTKRAKPPEEQSPQCIYNDHTDATYQNVADTLQNLKKGGGTRKRIAEIPKIINTINNINVRHKK